MDVHFKRSGTKLYARSHRDRLPDEWGTLSGFSDQGRATLITAFLMGTVGIGGYVVDRSLFDGSLGVEGAVGYGLNVAGDIFEHAGLVASFGCLGFVACMLFFMKGWKGKPWPIHNNY